MPVQAGRTVQLVLQATPFCNLDCTYCYLPDRSDRRVLPDEVLRAAFSLLADSGIAGEEVDVRWHAGEPLVVPPDTYRRWIGMADGIVASRFAVSHSLQTNGTLIDHRWCRLFAEAGIRVGVSIDGPERLHDAHRVTRRGDGTFPRVMRGIARLAEAGIPFDTISVVTPETLRHQDEFLDFFGVLRPRSLGINVEESEGAHVSGAAAAPRFAEEFGRFVRRLIGWERRTGIVVRELDRVRGLVRRYPGAPGNSQNEPLAILTVDVAGNLYTFSPELAGLSHARFPTFAIGNVLTEPLDAVLRSPVLAALAAEVRTGVELCRARCEYYRLCGGGAPSNKLFENGSLASTETLMCRCVVQAAADAVLDDLEAGAPPVAAGA
jgi:uncharacterized protein